MSITLTERRNQNTVSRSTMPRFASDAQSAQISRTLIAYNPSPVYSQGMRLILVSPLFPLTTSILYSLDDTHNRIIIMGDVHGMNKSLQSVRAPVLVDNSTQRSFSSQ